LVTAELNRVTEVAFALTVRAAEATGCTTNSGMTAAVTEFRGDLFNDGTGSAGSEGDVIAAITVNRDTRGYGTCGYFTAGAAPGSV
jgi:hypothetical protein